MYTRQHFADITRPSVYDKWADISSVDSTLHLGVITFFANSSTLCEVHEQQPESQVQRPTSQMLCNTNNSQGLLVYYLIYTLLTQIALKLKLYHVIQDFLLVYLFKWRLILPKRSLAL